MVVTLRGSLLFRGLVVAFLVTVGLLFAARPALAQETETDTPASTTQEETTTTDESIDSGKESSLVDDGIGIVTGGLDCLSMFGIPVGDYAKLGASVLGKESKTCGDVSGDVVSAAGDKIGDAVEDVAEGATEKAALSFGNAGAEILKFALGWWITTDSLDANVFETTVASITEYTFYIQVAAFALSMILLGARLAMARSGSIRDTSEEGFRQMARATLVAGAFTTLVIIGTRLSDGIANWFMNGTVGSDPTGLVEAMVSVSLYAGPAGMALLFVIGLLGILGGLVMAFLMLMRTGFLVLMAAALPIAGAAGGTKVGSQAFDKMISWTIAWLLVKPVGAFVIGCSAMLFLKATPKVGNSESGDAMMALTGVILLCAAALVLPALMRMIVPNVGALGGGGSGAAAGAALGALAMKGAGMMAGGGAPTGAAAVSGGGVGGGDSTTPPPPPPPPGAPGSPGALAPTDFGSGGNGHQPGGNGGGTPNPGGSGGGGPEGSESGTPAGSGATPPSADGGGGDLVTTGAAPQFNSGGFEK